MSIIQVPYHLDEYLPDLDVPLPPDVVITPDLPGGDVWGRLGALYSSLAAAVAGEAGRGGRPVVMSGDCTMALGTMSGLQRAGIEAGIVWFDAHGDVQTLETTTSGYLGGLPLRLLVGYRPELIAARLGLRAVPERQVTLVGARDLDPPRSRSGRRADSAAARSARWMPPLPGGPGRGTWTSTWSTRPSSPACGSPAPWWPEPGPGHRARTPCSARWASPPSGVAWTWDPGHPACGTARGITSAPD